MKGIERQDNLVLSDQFIAELFHAQAALSTQREDDYLLVRGLLYRRRSDVVVGFSRWGGLALALKATPPFA